MIWNSDREPLALSYLEPGSWTVELDWHPSFIQEELPRIRLWLEAQLHQMQADSHADNWLRHFGGVSERRVVPLDTAADEIIEWMLSVIPHLLRILEAPNLHDPYTGYVFRLQFAEQKLLSIAAMLHQPVSDLQDCVGEIELYCYRLKKDRFVFRFTSSADVDKEVSEEIAFNATDVATLLKEGQLF